MKRFFSAALLALAGLVVVLLVRALILPSRQVAATPAPPLTLDADALAERLAASLRFQTVSHQDPAQFSRAEFDGFHRWLAETYPRMHAQLGLEQVSEFSLLYTWKGRDPSLPPLLLMAHQDVVPVDTPERWAQPPFEGRIADGFVWGRGAIDDKSALLSISEAVELLLGRGFQPERTVLLAFGHDEEVGGPNGAVKIAELLAARGVHAQFGVDEGMAILEPGTVPGLSTAVAMIGIAEKGSVTLELVASAEGGHSSTPPRQSAAGVLAAAIQTVEANPMPGGIGGVTGASFEQLAPEMPLWARVVFANLWLFGKPLDWLLSGNPAVNALLRTTTAVTMLSGSPKENVLPSQAIAGVNFRILPGDTREIVRDRVRGMLKDPRVEVRFRSEGRDPSAVSPTDTPSFELLQRTIREVFPGTIVAPALVLGGTDARSYGAVTKELYRFEPFHFDASDLKRPHGIDERLSVSNYAEGVRFQVRLIENAAGSAPAQ